MSFILAAAALKQLSALGHIGKHLGCLLAPRAVDLTCCASISKEHLDLVPLRMSNDWSFDSNQTIRLAGAHGAEIVRSIHVTNEVNHLRRCICPAELTTRIERRYLHRGRGWSRKSVANVNRRRRRAGASGSRETEKEKEKEYI